MPLWGWPVLALPAFALWWCFVLWVVGQLFGWGRLACHYRAHEHFTDTRWHFRSAKIGWSNYSGCLTVGSSAAGLYLAVFFPFRPGHPPLFIPWADVTARVSQSWPFGSWLELRFEKVPSVALYLPRSLGDRIAADANRSWASDAS